MKTGRTSMKTWAFVTVLAVSFGSVVAAHESATGVVKELMEKMERFEELIERIFAMIHGELTYDAGAVRRAAEEIRDGAGRHMTALFPEGSNGSPSEAKDEVWRDFKTFEHYSLMLENWSGELATQADKQPRGNLPKSWEEAEIERRVPVGKEVHVILDNYAAHKHAKVRAWLERHPRWTFHFVPTSSSWLNAVEGFFAKLTRRRLQRGVFHSLIDLQGAINRFIAQHNATEAKPFHWTADPDKIIAARNRGFQTLALDR